MVLGLMYLAHHAADCPRVARRVGEHVEEHVAREGVAARHKDEMPARAEAAEAANAIKLLGGEPPVVKNYRLPGTDIVRSAVIIKKSSPTPAKYPRRWARISKQPL